MAQRRTKRKLTKRLQNERRRLYITVFSGNASMLDRIEWILECGKDPAVNTSGSRFLEEVFAALVGNRPPPHDILDHLIDPVSLALEQLFVFRDQPLAHLAA